MPETRSASNSCTVAELATRWRCDEQLIYRRIRRGELRAFKVGTLWRIPMSEVDRIETLGPVVDEDGVPVDKIEAHIAAVLARMPPLTNEQRIRISAMLLTGSGGDAA